MVVTREPEWDDEQRDWAFALKAAEDNQCTVCGGPMHECTDPASEFKWDVPAPVRCHRGTALAMRQAPYLQPEGKTPVKYPHALLWSVRPKP